MIIKTVRFVSDVFLHGRVLQSIDCSKQKDIKVSGPEGGFLKLSIPGHTYMLPLSRVESMEVEDVSPMPQSAQELSAVLDLRKPPKKK